MASTWAQEDHRLQQDFHAFSGGAHLGIVIACVGDHFIHDDVGVVGIVMIENQFLRAAFHHDIYSFAPVGMSPASAASGILLRQILGIVDQNVGAFRKLAYSLVESGIARLIIGGIHHYTLFSLNAKSQASLGMIEPCRLDTDAVLHVETAVLDIAEIAPSPHLVEIYREIWRGHLVRHYLLKASRPARGMKEELALGALIERAEKGHPLDVVPVKMRDKDVS